MDRPPYSSRKSSSASSPVLMARRTSSVLHNNANNNISSSSSTRPSSKSISKHGSRRPSNSSESSVLNPNQMPNNSDYFNHQLPISPKLSFRQPHLIHPHVHPRSRSRSRSQSRSHSHSSIENTILNINLDNTLPLDFFKKDILSVIKSLKIPKWRKIDKSNYKIINLNRISGAMTNCVYKLTYQNYYPLLLRIYGDVENIIDRNSELLTLVRLSKKNIGPKLLGCFNNGRFEEFLNNSITLNKSQIRDSKISRMIARRMKEFHYGVDLNYDEFHSGPKAWLLIDKWIDLVDNIIKNSNSNLNDELNLFILNWLDFKKLVQTYKNWLYSIYGNFDNLKDSLKFCHNDTQYGNLLFYSKSDALSMTDDDTNNANNDNNVLIDDNDITNLSLNNNPATSSTLPTATASSNSDNPLPIITDTNFKYDTRLTVIDFEYAGQNLPAYDITNHFSEWMYDYHHPTESYKTDELKYPTVEERINFLNSYIQFVPGSATPNLNPISLNSNSNSNSNSASTLKHSHSVVSMKLKELPATVVNLYNETIYWRSACSIFWALWAILSKGSIISTDNKNNNQIIDNLSTEFQNTKFDLGPNGETYKVINNETDVNNSIDDADDEFLNPTLDDEFDHLKYALGKIGIFIGDMIQFGLLDKNSLDSDTLKHIKYLDTELLPVVI
jgi:choline kinase